MRVGPSIALLMLAACAATPDEAPPGATVKAASICIPDREALLALDIEAFDQTRSAGWRGVGDDPACMPEVADLIAEYRARAVGRPGFERHVDTLLHHEAQLLAGGGQTERALPIFREVLAIHTAESEGVDDTNTLRTKAEIAFLEGDRAALVAARDQLAALPMPDGMAKAMEVASARIGGPVKIEWPLNLGFTDKLVKCFGRSYREATQLNCPEESAGRQP